MKKIIVLFICLSALFLGCDNPLNKSFAYTKSMSRSGSGSVDIFLVAGQSNAWGAANPVYATQTTPDEMMIWNNKAIKFTPQTENNDSCNYGSFLPAFAKKWHEKTGRTVYFVQTAIPGSGLVSPSYGQSSSWNVVNGTYLTISVNILTTAEVWLNVNNIPYVFKGIIWSQGESDAMYMVNGNITPSSYQLNLLALAEKCLSLFPGSQFGIIQTGKYLPQFDWGFTAVRTYQQWLCNILSGTKMLYTNTVNFPSLGLMLPDQIHYNQTGLNMIGEAAANNW